MPSALQTSATASFASESLLLALYALDAIADVELGSDLIFDHVDTLLNSGRFAECDELLAEVEVGRLSPAWMRSFLTITKAAEKQLRCRRAFVARINSALDQQIGSESRARLLRNIA